MSIKGIRHVGVDVSARTLHVAVEGREDVAEFNNTPDGFKKLASYAAKGRVREVRFVIEATGAYHIDLACFLHDRRRCVVMVANPRLTKHFHSAQGRRAKTDAVDALSLLHFAQRMPFEPWTKPSKAVLELRASARFVDQVIKDRTRLRNQLHAAQATDTSAAWVLQELQQRIDDLSALIERGQARLLDLVAEEPQLQAAVKRLATIPGIGPATAVRLAAEYAFLDRGMTSKEITAWAGLDPRPRESGTSVRGRRSMSKQGNPRVRRMMYMSSLAAARKGPFADLKARVEARSGSAMSGLGAVMRKLLIVSWAIYRSGSAWDAKLASPREKSAAAA